MDNCLLPNYVLANRNRARVWDLLKAICGKLMCEGVYYKGYTTQRALNALSPCVSGPMLQSLLMEYEHEIVGMLAEGSSGQYGARVKPRYEYDGLSPRMTGTVLAVDGAATQVLWDNQSFAQHSGKTTWCGSMHLEPA